jgi:hypothetical protein
LPVLQYLSCATEKHQSARQDAVQGNLGGIREVP